MIHACDATMLQPDADGFYSAVCVCSWSAGGYYFPDLETAIDELVEHAFQAGIAER